MLAKKRNLVFQLSNLSMKKRFSKAILVSTLIELYSEIANKQKAKQFNRVRKFDDSESSMSIVKQKSGGVLV